MEKRVFIGDVGPGLVLTESGTLTIAATVTPQPVKAASTPCALVILSSEVSADGTAANAAVSRVGTSSAQTRPLPLAGTEISVWCSDANDVYVDAGANGDKVEYSIFRIVGAE